jgi:predicted permease
LRPGVDVAQAQQEMNGLAARLGREYPRTDDRWGVQLVDLRASIGGDSRTMLLLLLGAVTILQLIACANVANLLFTRAMARHKEFALRAALGASRGRILQQLLIEAILLAAAAGLVGLGLAFASLRLSSTLLAAHVPRSDEIGLDVRVALFAVTLSIVSGVLAGTLPAWRAGRPDLNGTLKEGGRGASTVGLRTRRVLVASEVALSLMLLMAAGVLLQSLLKLRFVDAGFRADNVLTMRVALIPARYPTPAHRAAFYEEALRRLRVLPGVDAASTINTLPLTTGGAHTLTLDGYPPRDQAPAVQVRQITPGYLATMKIPMVRGRDIREGDTDVLLVSRKAAEIYWGADDPVGRRASLNGISPQPHTVVGIVGDVKRTLTEEVTPTVYWYGREPYGRTTFALRTSVPPARVVPQALAVFRAVDPEQPVADIRTMEEVRDTQLAPQRLSATLLIVFAGVALLLAGIGIYSVLSYIVRGRHHEMAVRAALGAQSSDVVSLVLREALVPVAVGIAAGVSGGLASSQLLGALVFEASAAEPRLLALTAAPLLLVAGVAAVLPAYRALQVDPSKALH